MRQTIRDIAHYGADSIQIFMPGFSSHIKEYFPDPDHIYAELKALVDEVAPQNRVPGSFRAVLCSGSSLHDQRRSKNSPAWQAGLRKGDEILTVNGETPNSRVAAYGYLIGPGTRTVTYRSSQEVLEATWQNTPAPVDCHGI